MDILWILYKFHSRYKLNLPFKAGIHYNFLYQKGGIALKFFTSLRYTLCYALRLIHFTLKSLLLIYYASIKQADFFMHFSTIRSARNATITVIIIITTSIHIGVIASMVSPYAFPISAA